MKRLEIFKACLFSCFCCIAVSLSAQSPKGAAHYFGQGDSSGCGQKPVAGSYGNSFRKSTGSCRR